MIFGKTGTGKTTLAKNLIKKENRYIIIDALREYDNGIIIEDFESFLDYVKNNFNNDFKIICRFTSDEDIEYLFRTVFVIGNLTLLVEEAEIYINPYSKSNNFLRLVRYGRHKNVKIIGVARRTAELSMDFRAQTNRIISFKQTEKRDLEKLAELGLENLDKLSEHEYKEIIL